MTPAIVKVNPMKLIMEIYIRINNMVITLIVLKVSWKTTKKMSGVTVLIKILWVVKVDPVKVIMKIHSQIKTILRTLFVFKVRRMAVKKPCGETVMILSLSVVKVSPKETYHGDSQRNWNDKYDSLSAKGELDDHQEAKWRGSEDYESIDSEGRPYKTYHGDSEQD